MKKILLIIGVLLLLTGCTSKTCNCENGDIVNGNTIKFNKLKKMNVKITGTQEKNINFNTVKDLSLNQLTIDETSPLYSSKTKIIGVNIIKALAALDMKVDFEYIIFKNTDTSIKYTTQNIDKNSYLVFYVNGVELDKPMFVQMNVSSNYWVENLDEMILGKN